jgi:hypothetical protein
MQNYLYAEAFPLMMRAHKQTTLTETQYEQLDQLRKFLYSQKRIPRRLSSVHEQ